MRNTSSTFSAGGERVKGSPEPGRFLPPLPPGKGCKSQEATQGWGLPEVIFMLPSPPLPKAELSPPAHPPHLPGVHVALQEPGRKDLLHPIWAPSTLEQGQRKPPGLLKDLPAPASPLPTSMGGQLGHTTAQAAFRDSRGAKAMAPQARRIRGDPAPWPPPQFLPVVMLLENLCWELGLGWHPTSPSMTASVPGRGWGQDSWADGNGTYSRV